MNLCLYVFDADVMYEVRLRNLIISSITKHDKNSAMRTPVEYETLPHKVQDAIFAKLMETITKAHHAT